MKVNRVLSQAKRLSDIGQLDEGQVHHFCFVRGDQMRAKHWIRLTQNADNFYTSREIDDFDFQISCDATKFHSFRRMVEL